MSEQPIRLCSVTLLSRQPFSLDPFALLQELEKRCGQVKLLDQDKEKWPYAYIYLDVFAEYEDKAIPVGTMINVYEFTEQKDAYARALQQSWDWEPAKTIVPECRYAISIIDFMASNLDPEDRLNLMHQVVLSVLELVSCDAIFWENSEQFTDPAVYQERWQGDHPHLLYGMVNVRLFRISTGKPGEMVMDSLGLHILRLPDVQCHFVDLNPDTVANFLFNVANYLLVKGDVIHDDETVPGFEPDTRWPCRHEISLIGPEREVLDIEPNSPYAAGRP